MSISQRKLHGIDYRPICFGEIGAQEQHVVQWVQLNFSLPGICAPRRVLNESSGEHDKTAFCKSAFGI